MSAFEDDADDFLRFVRAADPALTGPFVRPAPGSTASTLAQTLAAARAASSVPLIRSRRGGHRPRRAAGRRDPRAAGRTTARRGAGRARRRELPALNSAAADDGLYRSIRYARDPWAPDALEAGRATSPCSSSAPGSRCAMSPSRCGTPTRPLRSSPSRVAASSRSRTASRRSRRRTSTRPRGWRRGPRPPSASFAGCATRLTRRRQGADWRELVTSSATPHPALWRRLGEEERQRFLRHLRPYWKTHRHRSPLPRRRRGRRGWSSRAPSGSPRAASSYVETDGGVTGALRERGRAKRLLRSAR